MKIFAAIKSHPIVQDGFFLTAGIVGVALHLAGWFVLFFASPDTEGPIVLHYTIGRSVDIFGGSLKLYLIPLFTAAVFLINTTLSVLFYTRQRFAAQLLTLGTILVQVFALLALAALLAVNK